MNGMEWQIYQKELIEIVKNGPARRFMTKIYAVVMVVGFILLSWQAGRLVGFLTLAH